MRLKHSNKKHQIVYLAAQKIGNITLCNSFFKENNDDCAQDMTGSRQNMQNSQEMNVNMESSLKSNFKECRIRQFIGINKHAPTHSDIEYIDTIDNYKSYLKKKRKLRSNSNKQKQKIIQVTGTKRLIISYPRKSSSHKPKCIFQQFNLEQANYTDQKLMIIKEKIDRVRNLSHKYSSEKQVQDIYEQIYKTKTEESECLQNAAHGDHFQLISLQDYKVFDNSQLQSKRQSENLQNKHVNQKFVKKTFNHEAKRWYQPKYSQTQRKIDPQGLIRMINLGSMRHKKSQQSCLQIGKFQQTKRQNTLTNQKQSIVKQFQVNKHQSLTNKRVRPCTASHHKILTYQLEYNLNSNKSKVKFPENELHLKQRIKGVRHVERQQYGWKDFKIQMQNFESKDEISMKESKLIFEYPWNKRVKSFSTNNHCRNN